MKDSTRKALKRAAAAAGMSALLVTASACGGRKTQETTAPESTAAVEETAMAETSAAGTEASSAAEASAAAGTTDSAAPAAVSGKLAEFLTQIDENFTDGGSAGISLRAASCAADLMTWYMEEKPQTAAVTGESKKFIAGVSDAAAFRDGLKMVRGAAEQTAGSDGGSLLSDAGWKGTVTWTAKDVAALFDAIEAGTAE